MTQSYQKSKIKFSGIYRSNSNSADVEKSQHSLYSEGRGGGEAQNIEQFFSFSQNFTNIQQTQKIIQEKANSLSKIKSLEQQLKYCKSRSSLWDKVRVQINNVNKYLKLSAISLGCSDSAIMKEFFQAINALLQAREGQSKDQKVKAVKMKQKQSELFEKLVQSNKKKYQLQQKIVQYEYEISKLNGLNSSLRQKSRLQSTERSSKIIQFHQETLMTIQQKEGQLQTLEQRYEELKLQLVSSEQKLANLNKELQEKEQDLVQTKDQNQQLYLQCQALKRQLQNMQKQEKCHQQALSQLREQLEKTKQQNEQLIKKLKDKREELHQMRSIIEDAKNTNQQYFKNLQAYAQQEESKRQQKIALLLQKEQNIKSGLTSNIRFAINRKKSKKGIKGLVSDINILNQKA